MAGDTLDIDLVSQAFMRDPFPTLTRLREAGPVVRVKVPFLGKTWIATTHEAVTTVLKDDSTFVRSPKNAGKKQFAGMHFCLGAQLARRSAGGPGEVVHPVSEPVARRARLRAKVHREARHTGAGGAPRAVDVSGTVSTDRRRRSEVAGFNSRSATRREARRGWPALLEAFLAWLDPGNFHGHGRQRTRLSNRTRPLLDPRE